MRDLLRQVSRSFYLTLRILPRSVNPQLSLAYLLARATDTVADTELIEARRRMEALQQMRKSIQEACQGEKPALPDLGDLSAAQTTVAGKGNPAERILLENLGDILDDLRQFSAEDRRHVGHVLEIITSGQEMDLQRFHNASADRIVALDTQWDLDRYIYSVAGCVGEFWTKMCRAHVFPDEALDDSILLANGTRFGKGLQLVNILRDLPRDLRQGRCYIPQDQLSKHGLQPRDLLDASQMDRFRPLYEEYLRQTEDHLAAGWLYTTMLPARYMRVRLACSWPILIGVRTIEDLRRGNVLDDRFHIRIAQSDTWRLLLRTIVFYPAPKIWNGLFGSVRRKASRKL
ncbi:MAG TPA: phytoene/squalene synthase family protein [Acidobacteriota bacterium]|nr:phytoene/squalene synthase family protein [Acidobacteriota bacterium]